MAQAKYHRFLSIVMRDFLLANGMENTRQARDELREGYKAYFEVESQGALTDEEMIQFITDVIDLMATEQGTEVPLDKANQTMSEQLKQANDDYESRQVR